MTTRSEVTLVYYAVWWAGRRLSPVDDVPPSNLVTTLQSADLHVYSGDEQKLAWVRSVLIHGLRLSVASVADVLAAVKEAWMSINSRHITDYSRHISETTLAWLWN